MDLANYEGDLKEYESQVSKIERDYDAEYNAYLKKLSDYESRKLKASMEYEKTYNDIAYKNAEARRIYLEEKAKIEAENKMLKENYEKEVADIKAANEKAVMEYNEKLAKWKADKIRVENTVKTKDLIDSVLKGKIDELKKKGVNITVGRDEVTEVDGSSGKISEAQALEKLKELSRVKLAELDRAEKSKVSGDATNKEYSDRVATVKNELNSLSNIKVTYTNGGVVGNVVSDISELNKKLEQAKAFNKLAGKIDELNSKISEHDKGIVGKLKAAGVSENDANTIYSKKTVVPLSEFSGELEALKKKESLSDSDIDAFISKVTTRLDTAKATVDKAIKAAKSGGTGEALDDVEYDKKWAEFQEKIEKFNRVNNEIRSFTGHFFRGNSKIFNRDIALYKNVADVVVKSTKGDVTYYEGKDVGNSFRNEVALMSSPRDPNWKVSNKLSFGNAGDVNYARLKLAKDASITFDLNFPSDHLIKNDYNKEVSYFKTVNGKKVLTSIKTMRFTITNNGTLDPDGSSIFYLMNNPASPIISAYTPGYMINGKLDNNGLIDISSRYNEPYNNYTYSYEYLDENGDKVSFGFKHLDANGNLDDYISDKTYDNVSYYGFNSDKTIIDANGHKSHPYEDFGDKKPENWDSNTNSKMIVHDRENNKGGYIFTRSVKNFENKGRYTFTNKSNLVNRRELQGSNIAFDNNWEEKLDNFPTFPYTRKNTPVEVLETIPNTTNIDIPVKTPIPSSFTTINPVKVVYKYKETFTEKEPISKPDKPVPDETTVHYKQLPKEPIPTKQPNKTLLPETPPVAPIKPTIPLPPTAPIEPKTPTPIIPPILNLPPLPQKPWEPDQLIEPKLPKTINLTVTINEYVLKEAKISHANSLAIKHKLASFANSFQLRKL